LKAQGRSFLAESCASSSEVRHLGAFTLSCGSGLGHAAAVRRFRAITLFCGIVLVAAGCQERSSAPRAWRASDHDHADLTAKSVPQSPDVAQQASGRDEPTAADEVAASPHDGDDSDASAAMRTWAQRCMGCHGQIGAGDGPRGEGMNVPDLSAPIWQSKTSDAQISKVVRLGQGTMPGFPLEPQVVARLVKLIRRMGVTAPSEDRSVVATPEPPKKTP
jgi:mono/diheme cytochrome c family protein